MGQIEILSARRYVTGDIVASAHLDNAMFLEDGVTPDPVWVITHSWYIDPDDWAQRTGPEKDAWIESMRDEFAALCKSQREIVADREAGGTVLPIEGATFNP